MVGVDVTVGVIFSGTTIGVTSGVIFGLLCKTSSIAVLKEVLSVRLDESLDEPLEAFEVVVGLAFEVVVV